MTDWAIPQQAKLKYTQLFNLHDRSRSGFLSGLQCRDILLQSGLPRPVLAEIWNLSDIDGDGQLTREEFILAMHLTNYVRSGQTLPTELPADLVPPSYRRTRSISATSVHSATSGSSVSGNINDDQVSQKSSDNVSAPAASVSVLNTNTFEDKRRENFEKGRAELERRRLKIIEQQTSVLAEQLATSKKEVTKAKANIDLMRTERDTKMGLITSLEAQLKTLQERKAYLNYEELSLIAIAKDLNLVNPAQAELDELATQAKQQSINQMKENLGQFVKEKEEKLVELAEVTKRLEESKMQLKTLAESVGKTYETYKEKVAKAKEMREQFINENKTQTVDLDSVWGSAPTFNSSPSRSVEPNPNPAPIDLDPWNSVKSSTNDQSTAFNSIPPAENESIDIGKVLEQKVSEPVQIKRYKALYAFEARNPDELTISPGDTITGTDEVCEPGWLSGRSNGRVGLFPEAYVEPLPTESIDELTINNNIPTETTTTTLPSNQGDPTPKTTSTSKSSVRYKVVYAFDARNHDELTISPGDIIIGVDGAHEPGWLMGMLNGQKGLFPEAYVERMPDVVQDPPEAGVSIVERFLESTAYLDNCLSLHFPACLQP